MSQPSLDRSRAPTGVGADRTVGLLRNALAALGRERRSAKLLEGVKSDRAQVAGNRFKSQYIEGLRSALEGHNLLTLDVMPDALWYADHSVLDATERKGDMVEVLYSEGVRSISIEAGVSDKELELLGAILSINWQDRQPEEPDLQSAIWDADLSRIRFELVERLKDAEDAQGDSTSIDRIENMIAELEAEVSETEVSGTLKQDEVEILLRLRDTMDESEKHLAKLAIEAELTPRIQGDLAALADGTELSSCDIPGLLGLCMHHVESAERVESLARALLDHLIRQIAAQNPNSSGLHRLLDLLDPEATPGIQWRSPIAMILYELNEPDALQTLKEAIPLQEDERWRGLFFSLGTAIHHEEILKALAENLPTWSLRVISDAVVLREQLEKSELFEPIRERILSGDLGRIRLGLAMANRLEDARLGEPLLALTSHSDATIRESALFALRRQPSPRLRTRVQELFEDPAEGVRLEVLRHAVASKDQQVARKIEGRLLKPEMKQASDAEIRALCITMGRILKSESEPILLAFCLGQKPSHHLQIPKFALQGLKASNSRSARLALQRIVNESPRLATEAESILRGMGG